MGTAMSGEVCHLPCAHVLYFSPYNIFHVPCNNKSYLTLFDIVFQPLFPISFMYSFSHYIILMRIHVVYSAHVIYGIHGCVSAHARHELFSQ